MMSLMWSSHWSLWRLLKPLLSLVLYYAYDSNATSTFSFFPCSKYTNMHAQLNSLINEYTYKNGVKFKINSS